MVLGAAGNLITVTRLTVSTKTLTAYNFTVDDLHTYYVGVDPVLVHNSRNSCEPPLTTRQQTTAAAKLGYKAVANKRSSQETAIFFNKKGNPKYITYDRTAHKGGDWKGFDTVKDAESGKRRVGTYDRNLDRLKGKK